MFVVFSAIHEIELFIISSEQSVVIIVVVVMERMMMVMTQVVEVWVVMVVMICSHFGICISNVWSLCSLIIEIV